MNRPELVIADDSGFMRTIMTSLLEDDFDVVASVEDGRAAVRATEKFRPRIVLLDISMPIVNGLEAAWQIRLGCPLSRVVFVSEHREASFIQSAFSAGAAGYVFKSKMVTDLVPALWGVLAGKEYGRPTAPLA